MLKLVQTRAENASADRTFVDTTSLTADYLAFDRQRSSRRQYVKAFGGIAVLVLIGAAFGRVPVGEAWIVAGMLAVPPLVLATVEAVQWHRLARRLNGIRGEVQTVRKS